MSFDRKLTTYAKMIVNQGVALEPGEPVVIRGFIDAIELIREITKEAYRKGASNVTYVWADDVLDREFAMNSSEEVLNTYPSWQDSIFNEILNNGGVSISVRAPNFNMYEGVSPDRLSDLNKTMRKGFQSFSKAISNSSVKWVVVNAPSKQWAQIVYPELKVEDAINCLWEDIFTCSKLNEEDPIKALEEHSLLLSRKASILTTKQYEKLHYVGPGTDLIVDLPENHIWFGGGSVNDMGKIEMNNIPTYEIATLPYKYGVNGRLKATLPLVFNGMLLEDFWFEFKDGKVVDFDAKKGKDLISSILATDEGANYLGEVAIVSQDSEIASMNKLFYSTLFDENASCHFALGSAYPTCLKGAKGLSNEKLEELGVNTSIIHVDFMVGSSKLDIIAIKKDGSREYILKDGIFPDNEYD